MRKFLIKCLLGAISWLPLRVHHFNAPAIGWIMRVIVKYRTKVSWDNIDKAFPDKSEEEKKRIFKEFYKHLGRVVCETIWFGSCRNLKRLKRSHIVSLTNPEVLQSAYDSASGVMVLYSHAGNWEVLGGVSQYNYTDSPCPYTESNSCVVYKEMTDKVWDEIIGENRCAPIQDKASFDGYIESKAILRYILSHRNDKKIYNINTDQKPYAYAGAELDITFMGRPAKTMCAGAAVSHKLGYPVLYMRMAERKGGYDITYSVICEDASKMSVEDIMAEYYRRLEEDIKAQPENYIWSHRRWLIRK